VLFRSNTINEKGLILRPKTLTVGIGCNRGTDIDEIRGLLKQTFEDNRLSPLSIEMIASVDVKSDEKAICDLAKEMGVRLVFFNREELKTIENIETPSDMVEKHIGVKSVCEAAAILGAGKGTLIVPKRKSLNATVAIARKPFTS
jgi:cobalt-precorrin 5A hydrolase